MTMKAMMIQTAALVAALALAAGQAGADAGSATGHGHSHGHSHDHDHQHDDEKIQKGYFDDDQVAARPLADWQGEWQSVYPLLMDGELDGVMADKAAHGDKTAQEYRTYYEAGYQTDVAQILINGSEVSFTSDQGTVSGQYDSDGHEILTYEKGNRGVRFIFEKVSGDADAPRFIQFSDHIIAPQKSDHFHLYWGDDRAALLAQLDNWPTYYPASLSAAEIAAEMMAH